MDSFTALKRRTHACIGTQFRVDGIVHGVGRFYWALEMCSWRKVFVNQLPFGALF